jgi:glucose/arabinose dehydrogenase
VQYPEQSSSPPTKFHHFRRGGRRPRSRVATLFVALALVAIALSNVTLATVAGASPTTVFGQYVTPGTSSTLSLDIPLNEPAGVAFDSNGDLFIANTEGNSITVLPAITGALFGQSVTAGVATQLTAATGLDEPIGVAFDANGDLFISNTLGDTVSVLPASTGTIFGQSFTANQVATLDVGSVLSDPSGLAFDANGNLFIANFESGTVAVDPASTGTIFGQSVTADVGASLTAATGLDDPFGITVDANGDLFVADTYANTVMVLPVSTGTIFGQTMTADVATPLTVASGLEGPTGVAFDANGDLFISDAFSEGVTVLPASSGVLFGQAVTADIAATVTAASAAGLAAPFGLAFDTSGDLYISNLENNTVTELASTSVLIANQTSTLSAASGLDIPNGIVLDANGDLFIANLGNNTISVLPASTGTIFGQSVTADQITTLSAATGLNTPIALAMDANGDLFISNDGLNTISVLPASTGTIYGQSVTANQITTLQASVGFEAPFGLTFDANGDLFGASIGTDQVTVVPSSTGTILGQSMTANVETTLQTISGISSPCAIDFNANGDLFVSSNDTGIVTVVPATTGTLFGQSVTADVATTLTAASGLSGPQGFAFDSSGDLFITSADTNTLTVLPASTGTIFGQSVTADVATHVQAATGLEEPVGLAFDAGGDLFIADESGSSVSMIPANAVPIFGQSVPTTTLATSFAALDGPTAMAFDAGGDLFVSSVNSNTITVDPANTGTLFGQSVTADVATQLNAATGLDSPYGIALDAQGDLFIVNNLTNTVVVVPANTGTLFGQSVTANVATTLSAATGLDSPYGIVVDANGDLLITNFANNTITVVPASTGTVFGQAVTADVATTLTSATGLASPVGMALDANGDVFISNLGNNTISVLAANTSTIFGQSVTVNQTATLTAATGVDAAYGIALDASGDLFIPNNGLNTVSVVPASTGTILGQLVTANQAVILSAVAGLNHPEAPAFDSSGDLFVTNYGDDDITVVPPLSSSGPGPPGTPSSPIATKSTVSISFRSDGILVRGKSVTLTAALSAPGAVTFTDNGLAITGCDDLTTTTSATCQWTPSLIGANALVATLTPTSSSESASTSLIENVSVIGVPGAPFIKHVKAQHERVRLIETRFPTTGGAPILSYQYAINGVWHRTTVGHNRQITISGLALGHTYRVRLRARNLAGYGSSSNSVAVNLR